MGAIFASPRKDTTRSPTAASRSNRTTPRRYDARTRAHGNSLFSRRSELVRRVAADFVDERLARLALRRPVERDLLGLVHLRDERLVVRNEDRGLARFRRIGFELLGRRVVEMRRDRAALAALESLAAAEEIDALAPLRVAAQDEAHVIG